MILESPSSEDAPALQVSLDDRLGALARTLLQQGSAAAPGADWLTPLVTSSKPAETAKRIAGRAKERDREAVAAALLARNLDWSHPTARRRALRLQDPNCLVVVTGQQAGLLGGPQLTLSKLLAAVAWAEFLEQQTGRPAEAIFWIASEDHDWDEVAEAYLPLGRGSARRTLGEDREPLRMMGHRVLDERIESLFEGLWEGLSEPDRDRLAPVREIYSPGVNWTDAFARLLVLRLQDRCPLLLDACDPAIKGLQESILARLAEQGDALCRSLAAREQEIQDAGHQPQVSPQPGCSLLFEHHDGSRHRIHWTEGDGYGIRGEGTDPAASSRDQLVQRIHARPSDYSPTALSRPAVQDALLQSDLFLVGPGEFAYMSQASVVHGLLEIEAPVVALRPQYLIVDERRREQLEEFARSGLDLSTLLRGGDALRAFLAQQGERGVTDQSVRRLRELEQSLRRQSQQLEDCCRQLDASLADAGEKTSDHLCRGLDALCSRVEAHLARQDEQTVRRIEGLRSVLMPEEELQERLVGWLALDLRCESSHGLPLGETLLRQGLPLHPALFVLTPAPVEDSATSDDEDAPS